MAVVQLANISSTYKDHLDALYAYALHMGFDEQTAMDAIHDVFYKLESVILPSMIWRICGFICSDLSGTG